MSLAALIRKMVEAGATAEAIALAVEAIETRGAALEAHRASDLRRERNRRYYEKRLSKTSENVLNGVLEASENVLSDDDASRARVLCGEVINNNPPQKATPSSAPKGADRAKRLPETWEPNDEHRAKARVLGVPDSRLAEIVEEFRNYWLAEGGARARKLDWNRTFSNRLAEQAARDRRFVRPENGKDRSAASAARRLADSLAAGRDPFRDDMFSGTGEPESRPVVRLVSSDRLR